MKRGTPPKKKRMERSPSKVLGDRRDSTASNVSLSSQSSSNKENVFSQKPEEREAAKAAREKKIRENLKILQTDIAKAKSTKAAVVANLLSDLAVDHTATRDYVQKNLRAESIPNLTEVMEILHERDETKNKEIQEMAKEMEKMNDERVRRKNDQRGLFIVGENCTSDPKRNYSIRASRPTIK